jgi:membrane peptidoglycan carboxypeptidase
VQRGTAGRYRNLDAELGRPSAAKTGTSELFVDAWFVGYVPQLSTSVWVGYPNERRSMVNINGLEEINGENYPLDIWSQYMQGAVQKFPVQQFDTPSPDLGLEVKTDGRTYVKPPPPPDPPEKETTEEEPTDGPEKKERAAEKEPDIFGNDTPNIFEGGGQVFEQEPARPRARSDAPERRSGQDRPDRRNGRDIASPAPSSASPAADTTR